MLCYSGWRAVVHAVSAWRRVTVCCARFMLNADAPVLFCARPVACSTLRGALRLCCCAGALMLVGVDIVPLRGWVGIGV